METLKSPLCASTSPRGEGPNTNLAEPLTPSASAGSQEPLQSWSAGAYIDLAANGLMPKDELREKLRGLDAQISALKGEVGELRRDAGREHDERTRATSTLQRLREIGPEMLDLLDASQRRRFYGDLNLEVMAHRDGSFTLTWLVGLDLGEIWWEGDRTSTR